MINLNLSVAEAEHYLDQIPKFSKEKHTVDTVRQMLLRLGNPHHNTKIIHVAGTNGKGSVCAFLSSILRQAGCSTAMFTSPHLLSVKERFSFNGQDVEDEIFLKAFHAIQEQLPRFEEEGLGHPSYFEFIFLMFAVMLRDKPSDYTVLETGLGGRLDASNSVEHPVLTVITSISLDHMEYLGDTVGKIAGEKAGIIKAGVPVVYDNTSEEASAVIRARAEALGSSAYGVDQSSYRDLVLEDGRLRLKGSSLSGEACYSLDIPFAAEYQAVNSMLAVRAAELLSIDTKTILAGIHAAVWPGRMEQIQRDVYLDGAHNEGGIREFSKAAKRIASLKGGRRILLFAVVSDKDYTDMAEIICREFRPDVLILTQIAYSRGLDIRLLEQAAHRAWDVVDETERLTSGHDVRVAATVEEAFREALAEKKPEDTVFCAGSLYLIGEIKQVRRRDNHE